MLLRLFLADARTRSHPIIARFKVSVETPTSPSQTAVHSCYSKQHTMICRTTHFEEYKSTIALHHSNVPLTL